MALQLGALRDALLEAGVDKAKADAAAEEVAGYDNRLTRLTTMVQVMAALMLLLLGSQFGLWMEIGKVNAMLARIDVQLTQVNSKLP